MGRMVKIIQMAAVYALTIGNTRVCQWEKNPQWLWYTCIV